MADNKTRGQIPYPKQFDSLKPVDQISRYRRKREKSASEMNLVSKSRIERSKLRNQFKSDFQKHTENRLHDVNQLEGYLEAKNQQRTSEIKINSGCVFFNSQHREKVQELTIKQVIQGLEKNYLKFKDHYSSLVKRNPAIIKEKDLPCVLELREKEALDKKHDEWINVEKKRPNSVEYLVNDEYAHRHPTPLEQEQQRYLITQQNVDNNYCVRLDSGVSMNKNFVPPLKVTTRLLPKLKDNQVIVVDDRAMRPVAVTRKHVEQVAGHQGIQPGTKSIPARMNRLYRSKYGDLLVDLPMKTRITNRMINQIKDRFEISQRERDMQPGRDQAMEEESSAQQWYPGASPEKEGVIEQKEDRPTMRQLPGERAMRARDGLKDKEVMADFMQLLRVGLTNVGKNSIR